MSTARVTRKRTAGNAAQLQQPAQDQPQQQQPQAPTAAPAGGANLVEQSAVVMAALGYLAEKQQRRDDITAGGVFAVKLRITAQVDGGQIFSQQFDGPLTVGHDSEVAASHTPGGDKRLIALIMGKLNEQTREAIFRDLPAEYASGEAPEADPAIEGAVDSMLKQLRAGKKQARRGSVKFDGKPAQPSLSLIG